MVVDPLPPELAGRPELPASQKAALAYGVKAPLVYTSVAVTNWTAFEKLGLSRVSSPTMYHARVGLDEAVSLGDLRHAEDPSEPIVLSQPESPVAIAFETLAGQVTRKLAILDAE